MAVSPQDWQRILREHQFRCFYCAVQSYDLTKDHKHPRARGGADIPANIVPACHRCNAKKRTRTVEEYWPLIDHAARALALAQPTRDADELEHEWKTRRDRETPSPIRVFTARRLGGFLVETAVLDRWGAQMGPAAFMVYAAICQCCYQERSWREIVQLTGLPRGQIFDALNALEALGLIARTDDDDIDLLQASAIPDETSDAG